MSDNKFSLFQLDNIIHVCQGPYCTSYRQQESIESNNALPDTIVSKFPFLGQPFSQGLDTAISYEDNECSQIYFHNAETLSIKKTGTCRKPIHQIYPLDPIESYILKPKKILTDLFSTYNEYQNLLTNLAIDSSELTELETFYSTIDFNVSDWTREFGKNPLDLGLQYINSLPDTLVTKTLNTINTHFHELKLTTNRLKQSIAQYQLPPTLTSQQRRFARRVVIIPSANMHYQRHIYVNLPDLLTTLTAYNTLKTNHETISNHLHKIGRFIQGDTSSCDLPSFIEIILFIKKTVDLLKTLKQEIENELSIHLADTFLDAKRLKEELIPRLTNKEKAKLHAYIQQAYFEFDDNSQDELQKFLLSIGTDSIMQHYLTTSMELVFRFGLRYRPRQAFNEFFYDLYSTTLNNLYDNLTNYYKQTLLANYYYHLEPHLIEIKTAKKLLTNETYMTNLKHQLSLDHSDQLTGIDAGFVINGGYFNGIQHDNIPEPALTDKAATVLFRNSFVLIIQAKQIRIREIKQLWPDIPSHFHNGIDAAMPRRNGRIELLRGYESIIVEAPEPLV